MNTVNNEDEDLEFEAFGSDDTYEESPQINFADLPAKKIEAPSQQTEWQYLQAKNDDLYENFDSFATQSTLEKFKRKYGEFTPIYKLHKPDQKLTIDNIVESIKKLLGNNSFAVVNNRESSRSKKFMDDIIAISKDVVKPSDGLQLPLAFYVEGNIQTVYIIEGYYVMHPKVLEAIRFGFLNTSLNNSEGICNFEGGYEKFFEKVILANDRLVWAWAAAVGHRLIYNTIAMSTNAYISRARKNTVTAAHVMNWRTCVVETLQACRNNKKS